MPFFPAVVCPLGSPSPTLGWGCCVVSRVSKCPAHSRPSTGIHRINQPVSCSHGAEQREGLGASPTLPALSHCMTLGPSLHHEEALTTPPPPQELRVSLLLPLGNPRAACPVVGPFPTGPASWGQTATCTPTPASPQRRQAASSW